MKKNREKTQKEYILDHLRRGQHITSLEALRSYGCLRLGARIWDLQQDGHDIKSAMVRTHDGAMVAEYWLVLRPTQTRMDL